jgi:hypothetical protein
MLWRSEARNKEAGLEVKWAKEVTSGVGEQDSGGPGNKTGWLRRGGWEK